MKDLTKYTPTELLKLGNDTSAEHKRLKEKIIQDTYQIDELDKSVNKNLKELKELEQRYVLIIEEIDKR